VQSNSQVWKAYNEHKLDTANQKMRDYQRACAEAKAILVDNFGIEVFDKKQITQEQINDCIGLNKFIWNTDDIFENIISEIFFRYATDKLHAEARAGRKEEQLGATQQRTPPWVELNEIFEKFGFEYRFKDEYLIPPGGHSLNERPTLYAVDENGALNASEVRDINDLSDGEKSIISLVFGSLAGVAESPKQVLLLDEFDASLNPSLTQIFYEVLDAYFIKKKVMVIIATHSPTTIALAPEIATFYEVFKRITSERRVVAVTRDSYGELQVANEHYVRSISDQRARIEKLERSNARLNEILSQSGLPIVYVEGPTDVEYIRQAYELYGRAAELRAFEIDIIGEVTSTGTRSSNDAALKNAWAFLGSNMTLVDRTIVLLHDPESNTDECDRDGKLFKRRMPKNEGSPLSVGVESLFGNETITRARAEIPDCFQYRVEGQKELDLRIRKGRKRDVCSWIGANANKEDFVGFESLMAKIDDVVAQSS